MKKTLIFLYIPLIAFSISFLSLSAFGEETLNPIKGDINVDYSRDLKDAIISIRILTKQAMADTNINHRAAVTVDNIIGLNEAIYILQVTAETRDPHPHGFVYISPGSFIMGSDEGSVDEQPVHTVSISSGFYLSRTEVTQGEWFETMETRPWLNEDGDPKSYVRTGNNYPAVYISWEDAQAFIAAKNQVAGANIYRLPTEAEWEYACRAGSTTSFCFGDDAAELGAYAWYRDNTWSQDRQFAQKVGLRQPNEWGLHDMHGNVWEWCRDYYDPLYYSPIPTEDPTGPGSSDLRVIRGGCIWSLAKHDMADDCRSANRRSLPLNSIGDGATGFRLACTDCPE